MISYHLREENIFYLSKYFGGWKLTGVLWLYYMTICIIIKNKITIGLYIITPWCYLYYYAFFHTYNQQKLRKFSAMDQDVQVMLNLTFAMTLLAKSYRE